MGAAASQNADGQQFDKNKNADNHSCGDAGSKSHLGNTSTVDGSPCTNHLVAAGREFVSNQGAIRRIVEDDDREDSIERFRRAHNSSGNDYNNREVHQHSTTNRNNNNSGSNNVNNQVQLFYDDEDLEIFELQVQAMDAEKRRAEEKIAEDKAELEHTSKREAAKAQKRKEAEYHQFEEEERVRKAQLRSELESGVIREDILTI